MSILSENNGVYVTGGAGFIGSHVTELLLERNKKVVVIDNLSSGSVDNLKNVKKHKNLRVETLDIRDIAALKQVINSPFPIIHLAGVADIVPSIVDPEAYFSVNVTGTLNVLEAARQVASPKVIYAASSTCYGIPESFPTPECADVDPQFPYALTKYMGEELLVHWCRVYGIKATSLRLFNVYGKRARTGGSYGAVMGVFLSQKANGKPLTIVGDGAQTRDFTHVSDVAGAFLAALTTNHSEIVFNVGSGAHRSVKDIANLIGGPTVNIPKRPGEPDCTFADISKIKACLNWEPTVSLEVGLSELLEGVEDWTAAPLWDPESISKVTADWFRYLGEKDVEH
jgi:UDP-glucose 4-epimerase